MHIHLYRQYSDLYIYIYVCMYTCLIKYSRQFLSADSISDLFKSSYESFDFLIE